MRKGLVIYEPRGRAGEYAPLAVNLYKGCGHGCVYCYAPEATFTDRPIFFKPEARLDIIRKLIIDAPKAAESFTGPERRVLLCFSSDPYQPINGVHDLTRQAIDILHDSGFTINILTKGGSRACPDFDLLDHRDQYAATLTFASREKSKEWEPYAASPLDRMSALKCAKENGIQTWVSLEPIIELEETLEVIQNTYQFVDLYKIGKLNYHPLAEKIDWVDVLDKVIKELKHFGCQYYIKKDMLPYLK